MSKIFNAASVPLNLQTQGTVPDVSGALQDRMQPMVFVLISTSVQGFQSLRVGEAIRFMGNIQPFSTRQLMLRPEGERSWSWFTVHAPLGLSLANGDTIEYHNKQYRVMAKKDLAFGGFEEYHLITDWTGSGPIVGGHNQ